MRNSRRNIGVRRRNPRSNVVSSIASIRPVEQSVRIFQSSGDLNQTAVAIQIESSAIAGRSWKVSSFELTLVSSSSARVELSMFGSAENTSTKDITVGTTPVVVKFRVPRRSDYVSSPPETADTSVAVLSTDSEHLSYNLIYRVTFKPLRNDITRFSNALTQNSREL